jgi:hypothetical protein
MMNMTLGLGYALYTKDLEQLTGELDKTMIENTTCIVTSKGLFEENLF